MPGKINKRTRDAMPESLLATYDHVDWLLYDGVRPNRNIRLDMVMACVESFDWLVKLIADSPYCIADFLKIPSKGNVKTHCNRNCERCIRSHAYQSLIQRKEEEYKK